MKMGKIPYKGYDIYITEVNNGFVVENVSEEKTQVLMTTFETFDDAKSAGRKSIDAWIRS